MEERESEQEPTEDDESELKHTENSENEAQHSEGGENLEKSFTKSGNPRKRSEIDKHLKQETIIRKGEKLLKNHLVLPGCKCKQKCSNKLQKTKDKFEYQFLETIYQGEESIYPEYLQSA
ncbi:hypothetical protein JTB14_012996 [Gonioctena quinquepunctata]|nr:hypothetical protein JTB14_012996 [Gonioctena quinquepunctata]